MEDRKKALGLELRQIIQMDQTATGILQDAADKRREIEKETQQEQAEILADAEKRRNEVIAQVKAEQAEALEKRTEEAQADFEGQKKQLENTVQQHRTQWVSEMVANILGK